MQAKGGGMMKKVRRLFNRNDDNERVSKLQILFRSFWIR